MEKHFSQQNSMPVCLNYYLFKCLMSVLPEGKTREQNHWKRLAKKGGERPWLAMEYLARWQTGPLSCCHGKDEYRTELQQLFPPWCLVVCGGSSAQKFYIGIFCWSVFSCLHSSRPPLVFGQPCSSAFPSPHHLPASTHQPVSAWQILNKVFLY